jgi:hypothetical protein
MALTARGGVPTVAITPAGHRARLRTIAEILTGHRDCDVSGKSIIPRICRSMRLGPLEPRPER